MDVFALDAEVNVALAEGIGVGHFDAEDLEHGDHHRQLVDVGVAELQAALAAQGGAVVAEAVQSRRSPQDPSAEVAVVAAQLAGAGGQVGVDEPAPGG